MISLLDSAVFGELFGIDDRIAAAFGDRQRLTDLIAVEVALARAEAEAGVIPASAADAIAAASAKLTPSGILMSWCARALQSSARPP